MTLIGFQWYRVSQKAAWLWILTMVNGVSLESIELKEAVFDGHIAYKVESFHGPHSTYPILFLRQVPGLRSP